MCFSKCPHHVKHGKLEIDPEAIKQKCRGRGRPVAEVVKRKPLAPGETLDCTSYPFHDQFDYFMCDVYRDNFKSTGLRNGVQPTKDFQYFDSLASDSITDMELL
jgi:hypothetical protein